MSGLLIAAMLVARFFPETPIGQWMHWLLVDEPVRLAARLTLRDVVLAVVLVFAFQAFAMTATIDLALIAAVDTTVYLEAATAVWSAAALSKAGLVRDRTRAAVTRTLDGFRRLQRSGSWMLRRSQRRAVKILRRCRVDPEDDRHPIFA